ncbi:ZIP family metal transporter [Dokdonia sp. Dokd-P16]|uniref:ZIP family metal transporter n=1 Tax=Dokdonia sp. Dokd-P16 TaxID=2173169 RepID=UPI000D549651|nr:ZIP family metal transporter [Dokdonia sp. Dokd-P16]AWH72820.1 ZIP family metal transporter [Dokdonia sp. Dokd-P16]
MLAIILPILAVIIGFTIALIFKPIVNNSIKLLLSFSGAFLLSVIIFEFLPEVYSESTNNVGIYIMAGLLVQILLEFGSKGAEHGHMHHQDKGSFPFLLFVSLCLHSVIEGFPIADNQDLLYGVVIHKIPIAIIISAFLFNSKMSNLNSSIFLILFGLMTPIGAFLKSQFIFLQEYSTYVNAFVVGVLLHVSTTILFESSKNHQFNASKLAVILLGIIIAYFL